MKILLVEDDLEISKLLSEFLQENGYEVFCQYDGLHVLDCLRENNIDLILLDIMLPYRNGDTVLTAVRECSTVPIIIISAKGTTQVKSFFVCKFTFSLLGYCILCGVLAELCKDAALFFIVFCHIE